MVSPDSVTQSGEGSRAAPSVDRDPVAVLPEGLPADTVRAPVSAEVVAGGGLAKFVQGVADSTGGPVLLVSPSNPTAGVVVTPDQGSALAQDMGRNVVAMTTPGQAGREPRWTVFAADGSARPLARPVAEVLADGRGVAGLADASAAVPAASGGKRVARGTENLTARVELSASCTVILVAQGVDLDDLVPVTHRQQAQHRERVGHIQVGQSQQHSR
ncbi:hypothetical protein [Saccharopolyspora sp. ASAGF58]|uniref:hypothetical protein n=1 Tax=Saccharopolyspora sp. ASAGF58 TaxID=2719023 RepID=UPI0014467015|nr:hypothetical protein [Saccharopolyspora sp. ASAGF58]